MLELAKVGDLDKNLFFCGNIADGGGEDIGGFWQLLEKTGGFASGDSFLVVGLGLLTFFDNTVDGLLGNRTAKADDTDAVVEWKGVVELLDGGLFWIDEGLS